MSQTDENHVDDSHQEEVQNIDLPPPHIRPTVPEGEVPRTNRHEPYEPMIVRGSPPVLISNAFLLDQSTHISNTMNRMTAHLDAMERERGSEERMNRDLRQPPLAPQKEDARGTRRHYHNPERNHCPGKEPMIDQGGDRRGERPAEGARRSAEGARVNRRFQTITLRALTYGEGGNRNGSGQRRGRGKNYGRTEGRRTWEHAG